MSKTTPEQQPKINQRAMLRMAVGLLIIAGLIVGYQWYRNNREDLDDLGSTDTAGWVAAVEHGDASSQVVVIKGDGSILGTPDSVPGTYEREPVWRPDGNQIYFSSDRDRKSFNIYRWNLANGSLRQRTHGTLARTAPSFPPAPREDGMWTLLMTSAGSAWDLNPRGLVAEQVMPYDSSGQQNTGEDSKNSGEGGGDFGAGRLRIRKAMWGKNREWVIAVRRVEDERQDGEALLVQSMTGDPKLRVPRAVVFGEHIDFDVNAETGHVVFTVQGFQWPPAEPSPVPVKPPPKPYLHYVGVFNPDDPNTMGLVAASKKHELAYANPRISPDGSTLVLVEGSYGEDGLSPTDLAVMPARIGGEESKSVVSEGTVFEPSWHPNGNSIVYILLEAGKRNIYSIEKTGGERKRISDGKKSYANPQFSPQSK